MGDLDERFWSKVDCSGGPDACWPWRAYKLRSGHGRFGIGSLVHYAHRIAWTLERGDIPLGLCVLHSCDNPPCCNPKHLFLGTQLDNIEDMRRKGRAARGTQHPRALLTESIVADLRRRHEAGESYRLLALDVGLPKTTIVDAVRGRNWAHVGVAC